MHCNTIPAASHPYYYYRYTLSQLHATQRKATQLTGKRLLRNGSIVRAHTREIGRRNASHRVAGHSLPVSTRGCLPERRAATAPRIGVVPRG
mmetsp:Transcript_24119/g.52818  ORF Transcript_24119/g.52818 Transcript_24119/m.52818 type:complete len:92 (-) Transcript_24119:416-691(-)